MIPFYYPELKGSTAKIIETILTNKIIYGDTIKKFEKRFADVIGTKYAITFASARFCLYLLYKYFSKGKTVALPSYTCIPAIDAARWAGAKPYFLDIDLDSYNPKYTSKIKKIKNLSAISLSYLYGLVGSIDEFLEFSKENNIPIIEDSAIAIGGSYKKKKLGSIGTAGVFSLQSSKIFTSWKGGIITTNNKKLYHYLLNEKHRLRNPSKTKIILNLNITQLRRNLVNRGLYKFTLLPLQKLMQTKSIVSLTEKIIDQNPLESMNGISAKDIPDTEKMDFTNLQALVAESSLENLNKILKKRKEMAQFLNNSLSEVKGLSTPTESKNREHAYGRYPIRINNLSKFKVQKKLLKDGIEILLNYPYIIPNTKYYMNEYGSPSFIKTRYKNALIASKETFLLPFHTKLKASDLDFMVSKIKEIA